MADLLQGMSLISISKKRAYLYIKILKEVKTQNEWFEIAGFAENYNKSMY